MQEPNILNRPVSRGNLWGKTYTWAEAIENHAEESANGGDCNFAVTTSGVWMRGVGGRNRVYRTQVPKGAEAYALDAIERRGLAVSSHYPELRVCPRYA
jgi:hypothetical protein